MPSEFELIRKYFIRPTTHTELGVGDDCAVVRLDQGMTLAISTDMLVSGTHFFPDAEPFQLGHKVLAVNLSDLAAMGAKPRWGTLAVALPRVDESWIDAFARGFFSLAERYDVDLIGGDTTRGPLNFCVQIMGEVPIGKAIRRDGAKPGDDVWVSGELGDAALALAHLQGRIQLDEKIVAGILPRLHMPMPRIELGLALPELATSCIDISDGLLGDLGHILERSYVGAEVWLDAIPRSNGIDHCLERANSTLNQEKSLAQQCMLAGGDDYELCFTASTDTRTAIESLSHKLKLRLTRIGQIHEGTRLDVLDQNRQPIPISVTGFDHFQ